MRIAFDYGMGPVLPGRRPPRPGEDTKISQVMVIRRGTAEENQAESSEAAKKEDGIPVPGTDYRLTASPAAEERDREVHSHEQAHLRNLGGAAASGIIYNYRRTPDGESRAVGGKIKADLNPIPGNPRATLSKAQSVIRAALAPSSPSPADMRTAAAAYRLAQKAQEEINSREYLA